MALNKTTMANYRLAELITAYPEISIDSVTKAELLKYLEADSEGIIQDFIANATILPGTLSNGGGSLVGAGKIT